MRISQGFVLGHPLAAPQQNRSPGTPAAQNTLIARHTETYLRIVKSSFGVLRGELETEEGNSISKSKERLQPRKSPILAPKKADLGYF